ncbi:ParB/RepB/Spo0J family partition protein [Bosea caraganae]|uniref:ParB/RepB/Spo0J family partition protein n=2 Tax=Bosea caraganae TaxID=2763117 RepID=A0A370L0X9_9HYPH|nr:ParB/RepB/Spo0J family partition protein [Bosea caraganae]RDJ28566.1 ParB/RepB/Spo0J family partition protein [Bosea caraganae]
MKLHHIDLTNLKPSPLNVRKHGGEDVSDLVPLIRKLGVLQPLLVRPNCEGFEVIAGGRRLKACQIVAAEGDESFPPVPCAVMEDGDDAAAIEASLAENIARLPMDEIDQYQAFAALVKEGRTLSDIADQFGVTERLVKQRLAIANLIPQVLTLLRKDEIGGDTMRALTLATKAQQKTWLKRFRDPGDRAPQGRQLRQWLLGGEQIATSVAIFPPEAYTGAIVTDLFGEEAYFADPEAFWSLQMAAVAEKIEAYRQRGWSDIVVLEKGSYWYGYEYRKATKKEGGKVFVTLTHSGEVTFHEGFVTEKEARRKQAVADRSDGIEIEDKASRPELTKAALNYVDLHRHAAVRAALLNEGGIALRLMGAHTIAGSNHWRVEADPCRADKHETEASLSSSEATTAVAQEERAVLALLELDEDGAVMGNRHADIGAVFQALLGLEDGDVLRILTFVMAQSLSVGTALVDTLGSLLSVDMGAMWQADDAFLGLIRDRQTLLPMLEDIGGKAVAEVHKASPAKVLRSIIRQCATGDGREKVEGWVPPYLAFPAKGYTERGGIPQTA